MLPLALRMLPALLLLVSEARAQARLVNGLGELGEPSSVALVQGAVPEDGFLVCSGVLVGCDAVLTTAHCFNTNVAQKTHVYVPHAGFVAIESATRHPAYVDALTNQPPGWIDTTREDDISFVKLARAVTGVTPSRIPTAPPPPDGTAGFVVGFGRDPVTESGVQNPGIKRSGDMVLGPCAEAPLQGLDLLCWEPANPLPPPGEEVSTCAADSGGPLFVGSGIARVVAGITKGAIFDPQGQPDPCLPPVHPYDVNVHRHREWLVGSSGTGGIVASTGAFPLDTVQCGALGQLPEPMAPPSGCDGAPWGHGEPARACGFQGTLDAGSPEARYAFEVPVGTDTLRVALNGVATSLGGIDSDLYLRHGQLAQIAANDCAANGSGTLGFCQITDPSAGTWHVLVDQADGEGDHQVVVSLFVRSVAAAPLEVPGLSPGRGVACAALALAAALGASRARRGQEAARASDSP